MDIKASVCGNHYLVTGIPGHPSVKVNDPSGKAVESRAVAAAKWAWKTFCGRRKNVDATPATPAPAVPAPTTAAVGKNPGACEGCGKSLHSIGDYGYTVCMDCTKARHKSVLARGKCVCGRKGRPSGPYTQGGRSWIGCDRCLGKIRDARKNPKTKGRPVQFCAACMAPHAGRCPLGASRNPTSRRGDVGRVASKVRDMRVGAYLRSRGLPSGTFGNPKSYYWVKKTPSGEVVVRTQGVSRDPKALGPFISEEQARTFIHWRTHPLPGDKQSKNPKGDIEAFLNTPCLRCGAPSGVHCINLVSGKPSKNFVHDERASSGAAPVQWRPDTYHGRSSGQRSKIGQMLGERNPRGHRSIPYGEKRDYQKIDLFMDGEYVASTRWARTVAEAVRVYAQTNGVDVRRVKGQLIFGPEGRRNPLTKTSSNPDYVIWKKYSATTGKRPKGAFQDGFITYPGTPSAALASWQNKMWGGAKTIGKNPLTKTSSNPYLMNLFCSHCGDGVAAMNKKSFDNLVGKRCEMRGCSGVYLDARGQGGIPMTFGPMAPGEAGKWLARSSRGSMQNPLTQPESRNLLLSAVGNLRTARDTTVAPFGRHYAAGVATGQGGAVARHGRQPYMRRGRLIALEGLAESTSLGTGKPSGKKSKRGKNPSGLRTVGSDYLPPAPFGVSGSGRPLTAIDALESRRSIGCKRCKGQSQVKLGRNMIPCPTCCRKVGR